MIKFSTRAFFWLLPFVLIAALPQGALRAEDSNDHLIVPWHRVGQVSLDMTVGQVIKLLGEPTQKNSGPVVTLYYWRNELEITVSNETSFISQICALSSDYTTTQGLRPGLPEAALTQIMGGAENFRLYRGWWTKTYTNFYWGGLMVSVPQTGFDINHSIHSICVNHTA
jgi:hypothetical protein